MERGQEIKILRQEGQKLELSLSTATETELPSSCADSDLVEDIGDEEEGSCELYNTQFYILYTTTK